VEGIETLETMREQTTSLRSKDWPHPSRVPCRG